MQLAPTGRKRKFGVKREDDELNIRERMAGVYIFFHPGTLRFYVGVSADLYRIRSLDHTKLRNGKHHSYQMQMDYNADPRIEFYYERTVDMAAATVLKKQLLAIYWKEQPTWMYNSRERRGEPNRSGSAKRSVVIYGRYFSSMQEASEALGVTRRQVRTRVNSKKPMWVLWTYP